MANADSPFGLVPVRYVGGAPYMGACNTYYVPSTDNTAIYLGGLVKLAGSADADGTAATVTGNVASGDTVLGVVVGFSEESGSPRFDSNLYRAASRPMYVHVADEPDLLFEVQEDSAGGNLAATAVGGTCELTGFTSGSTTTGLSAIELDSSEVGTDGTDDVLIIGASRRVGNTIGSANAKWYVRLNNHALVDAAAGV